MSILPTAGALVTVLVLSACVVSCSKTAEEPARREAALEQRIAKLEAALASQGPRQEPAAARSGGAQSPAGTPHTGNGAPPAGDPQPPAGAGAAAGAGASDSTPGPGAPLEERIDALEKQMARTLKTVRIPLELNKSGNEVCAEAGHACLTLFDEAGSARYDVNDKFCGHMVADCNARVTRKPHCSGSNDYLLAPVKFYRTPGIKAECDNIETETCESSPADLVAICLD